MGYLHPGVSGLKLGNATIGRQCLSQSGNRFIYVKLLLYSYKTKQRVSSMKIRTNPPLPLWILNRLVSSYSIDFCWNIGTKQVIVLTLCSGTLTVEHSTKRCI